MKVRSITLVLSIVGTAAVAGEMTQCSSADAKYRKIENLTPEGLKTSTYEVNGTQYSADQIAVTSDLKEVSVFGDVASPMGKTKVSVGKWELMNQYNREHLGGDHVICKTVIRE